jgi:glycosyltransferase involved in cell wall biosynthesis
MGVPCTLLTSPATFEAVNPVGYDVSFLFFRFLNGPMGSILRRRPALRRMAKAISYPGGVWRSYCALKHREPGVFHIHFALSPVLDALLARTLHQRGWRVVYTFQQPHPEGAWHRWQYRRLMENCDVIVMHDEGLAFRLREIFPGCASKIASLTHGTELPPLPSKKERTLARSELGVAESEPLLLFFGMMKPYKGLEDLVDAMPAVLSRIPGVRLCIAGEPMMDMRAVLHKIAALPLPTVILRLGFVPQADVGRYFAAADLVLTCYREIAASSVLLQAQAYARAVLATRVGAMPALLEDGRCGFLAGENLAEAIGDALADRDHLTEIGLRGRERVERMHSWEHVAAETLRLYRVK